MANPLRGSAGVGGEEDAPRGLPPGGADTGGDAEDDAGTATSQRAGAAWLGSEAAQDPGRTPNPEPVAWLRAGRTMSDVAAAWWGKVTSGTAHLDFQRTVRNAARKKNKKGLFPTAMLRRLKFFEAAYADSRALHDAAVRAADALETEEDASAGTLTIFQ